MKSRRREAQGAGDRTSAKVTAPSVVRDGAGGVRIAVRAAAV
jgi:hypothetical protein